MRCGWPAPMRPCAAMTGRCRRPSGGGPAGDRSEGCAVCPPPIPTSPSSRRRLPLPRGISPLSPTTPDDPEQPPEQDDPPEERGRQPRRIRRRPEIPEEFLLDPEAVAIDADLLLFAAAKSRRRPAAASVRWCSPTAAAATSSPCCPADPCAASPWMPPCGPPLPTRRPAAPANRTAP
jgi:hypothetical protein